MKRLITAAMFSVVLLTSSMTSAYADSGVGSSPGSTAQSRACQAQAANRGQSNAKGVTCASLTVISNPCFFIVTGSGLQPGSTVFLVDQNGVARPLGTVAADGSFTPPEFSEDVGVFTYTVTATTASGSPISTSFTADC
jgi:hypothetical protein